jgi:hypothetical protein
MFSIQKLIGSDGKFYDLLEASAQQADSSVHHLVDVRAFRRATSIHTAVCSFAIRQTANLQRGLDGAQSRDK